MVRIHWGAPKIRGARSVAKRSPGHDMNDPFAAPPRWLRLSVGWLTAFVAFVTVLGTGISIAMWGFGLAPLPSLPKLALAALIQGLWNAFWIRTAYRLLTNRPNRLGGLFSSLTLYAVSVFSALACVALFISPRGVGTEHDIVSRVRGAALFLAIGAPSFYLARYRRAAARTQ